MSDTGSETARRHGTSTPGRRLMFAVMVLSLLCLFISPFFVDVIDRNGPVAKDGVLSYAGWGPLDRPVEMEGGWSLTWRGGAGGPPPNQKVTVEVPGRWSNTAPQLPPVGAVSYHLQIRDLPAGRYILHFPAVFAATEIAVDGEVVSRRGRAGLDKATTSYLVRSQEVFLIADGRPIDLRIDQSTFLHRDNGLEAPPLIGLAEPMQNWITLDWIRSLLLLSALLLLACYGGVVFLFRRNDRASLYLALGSVLLAPMIGAFSHDNLIMVALPQLSFLQMLTLQYITGGVAVALVLAYTRALFPKESLGPLFWVVIGLHGLFVAAYAGFAMMGDTFAMSRVSGMALWVRIASFLYMIAVVGFAAVRRRDGAPVFLLGAVVVVATAIYSDLVTNAVIVGVLNGLDLLPLGILVMLFSHLVVLAERWSISMGVAEQRSDDLAQLLDVNSSITAEIRLEALLTRIVEAVSRFIGADRATLFLYDAKTDELWSIAAEGVGGQQIRFPSDGGLAGACFTAGEAINIADAYADPRFNRQVDVATGYRTTSVLTIPVKARDGRKLGVMQALNAKTGKGFTDSDIARMNALSAQAAIAIDNAKLFAEVASERNYNESILRSMSAGVVTLDPEAKVAKLNDTACRILGVTREMLEGADARTALAVSNPWFIPEFEAVAASGQPKLLLEAEITTAQGDKVSANMNIVPLMADDAAAGVLVLIDDITDSKRMQGAMRRFMTQKVVDQVMGRGDELLFGAAVPASVLFADIRSFTSLAERLAAREVVEMLNEIFTELFEAVAGHEGVLDKFMGDGLMAVYGAPLPTGQDPLHAVDSAVQMIRMIGVLNVGRPERGLPNLRLGIGITSGEVIAGTIGSPKRMDYTVIGDSVNLAARLQSATKTYGVDIIIDEATAGHVKDIHILRELDTIRVRGREQPVTIFQVLADAAACPGLEAYRRGRAYLAARQWDAAAAAFAEAVALDPGDKSAMLMMERAHALRANPPAESWDGVWSAADAA
ncbi:MAG: GAF domain-containing protein [Phenylobacterium sp.]|uniref:adenylate/guanylate cyclase domain-containing protein n=1 Tax=Phenylobacterium sp. TaxID=1871053 RepID=UPI0011FECF09|nr:adenylate/guanylate cyclase domain-containing protein [Phenylobacterium sp.]TAL30812.1 MAG: GAF domain-containing protein [Phenylobacterium sp.]